MRGIANVEFKRDERDGRLKLIECNDRFTAANEQFRRAGLDLALFVYSRLAGRPAPPVDAYRAGVRLWHPGKDFRAFLELRRRGELTTAAWLRSVARAAALPAADLGRPRPRRGRAGPARRPCDAPPAARQPPRARRTSSPARPRPRRRRRPGRVDLPEPAVAGAHGR